MQIPRDSFRIFSFESAAGTTDVNSWINEALSPSPRNPKRILLRKVRATISFRRKMEAMDILFTLCWFEYLIGFYFCTCIFTDLFFNVFYIMS